VGKQLPLAHKIPKLSCKQWMVKATIFTGAPGPVLTIQTTGRPNRKQASAQLGRGDVHTQTPAVAHITARSHSTASVLPGGAEQRD